MLWNSFIYHIHNVFWLTTAAITRWHFKNMKGKMRKRLLLQIWLTTVAIIRWYYNNKKVTEEEPVINKWMSEHLWCCTELTTIENVNWTYTTAWCYPNLYNLWFNMPYTTYTVFRMSTILKHRLGVLCVIPGHFTTSCSPYFTISITMS